MAEIPGATSPMSLQGEIDPYNLATQLQATDSVNAQSQDTGGYLLGPTPQDYGNSPPDLNSPYNLIPPPRLTPLYSQGLPPGPGPSGSLEPPLNYQLLYDTTQYLEPSLPNPRVLYNPIESLQNNSSGPSYTSPIQTSPYTEGKTSPEIGSLQKSFKCGPSCRGVGPHSCNFKGDCLVISCQYSPTCGALFKARNAFNRHYMTTHASSNTRVRFGCPVPGCPRVGGNGFIRRDNLNQHRRCVHDEDIPIRYRFEGRMVKHPNVDNGVQVGELREKSPTRSPEAQEEIQYLHPQKVIKKPSIINLLSQKSPTIQYGVREDAQLTPVDKVGTLGGFGDSFSVGSTLVGANSGSDDKSPPESILSSIWDESDSVTSRSSYSGLVLDAVGLIANELCNCGELAFSINTAYKKPYDDEETSKRLRILLRFYSADLLKTASSPIEEEASKLIRTRARSISLRIKNNLKDGTDTGVKSIQMKTRLEELGKARYGVNRKVGQYLLNRDGEEFEGELDIDSEEASEGDSEEEPEPAYTTLISGAIKFLIDGPEFRQLVESAKLLHIPTKEWKAERDKIRDILGISKFHRAGEQFKVNEQLRIDEQLWIDEQLQLKIDEQLRADLNVATQLDSRVQCNSPLPLTALVSGEIKTYSEGSEQAGMWSQEALAEACNGIKFEPYYLSWFDRVRVWVEWGLGTPIYWWPLNPPIHPDEFGLTKMSWKCGCGSTLSSVISAPVAEKYLRSCAQPPRSTGSNTYPGNTTSQASGQFPTRPSAVLARSTSLVPQGGPTTIPYVSNNTRVGQFGASIGTFILCCIRKKPHRTVLSQVEKTCFTDDRKFFWNLRTQYCQIRGWRRWVGLSAVERIRFVRVYFPGLHILLLEFFRQTDILKFTRYYLDYVDCHESEELPPPTNPEYEYTPKPPNNPPILPVDEFLHYFEQPDCAGTVTDCLDLIPKRVTGELIAGQRVIGWGLQVREGLSFWRFLLLLVTVWLGTLSFASWWLARHHGDLQGAFVPANYATSFAAVCVVLPEVLRVYK